MISIREICGGSFEFRSQHSHPETVTHFLDKTFKIWWLPLTAPLSRMFLFSPWWWHRAQRAESAVAADVNWNQHIILLQTLVYCTVCCILPPINQACVESYNRQSSTEGVVCLSGMTSTAQNLQVRSDNIAGFVWRPFSVCPRCVIIPNHTRGIIDTTC